MANGINTDIFEPERKEEVRQNLYEEIIGQKQDPGAYTVEAPERPEMDEERRQQLQQLSKVSAISSGMDALIDAIGVGTSEDYAPSQTGTSDLGVSSFKRLSRMDRNYRNQLQQWKKNVLETDRYNQKARRKVSANNAAVDLQAAKQRYRDYQADAKANKTAEDQKGTDETWREAGMRLISSGNVKAGVAALGRSGMSTDEITGMIDGQAAGTGGTGDSPDPQTRTRRNMVRRHQELLEQVEGNESQHYTADGDPRSRTARELERIEEEMGTDLYNPIYQPEDSQTGGDEGGDDTENMVSPSNRQAMQQGLDSQQVREGLNDPASEITPFVQSYRDADSPEEQDSAMVNLERKLRDMGYPQPAIDSQLQNMASRFGMADATSAPDTTESDTASESDTTGTQQAQVDSVDSQQPIDTGGESFEEFKQGLNQERMTEFSEESRQRRQQLMNILKRVNSAVTKTREIVTSPLWALKEIYNNLSETRQKALYEQYQREQRQSTENNNNE